MKKILFAVMAVLIAPSAWADGAFVNQFQDGAATSSDIVTISGVVSGNTAVVFVYILSATETVTSVTWSCGTFTVTAGGRVVSGASSMTAFISPITSSPCTFFTVDKSSTSNMYIRFAQYSGINTTTPFDCEHSGTGTGTSLDSGSCSTSVANVTLVSEGNSLATSNTFTAGSGYTIRSQETSAASRSLEDGNKTSSGSYNATETCTASGAWIQFMLALKSDSQPSSATGVAIGTGVAVGTGVAIGGQ